MVSESAIDVKKTTVQSVPPVAMKWNWGAFLLSFWWALYFRAWIFVILLVPIICIKLFELNSSIAIIPEVDFGLAIATVVISILLGKFGGRIAWRKKSWTSEEQYIKVMNNWGRAGFVLVFITILIVISKYIIVLLLIESLRYIGIL